MADRVHISAHAKVNLFLRVLAKETSGFHAIETLFTLLELADDLGVERAAGGIELAVEGAETGPTEENLAYRAATLVLDATGNRFGVRLHLTKRIPVQSGLGGGSSDGAAALVAVNRLAADTIPRHELLQFAARLGSDAPFFASGAPFALAWGRGERLFRLPAPKPGPVLLAIPPFGLSTKAIYNQLDDSRAAGFQRGAVVLDMEALATWGGIGRLGGNDFESVVFASEPGLRDLFERLAATRPLTVRLTGSGSALLAVYRSDSDRDAAAREIGERDCRLVRTTTRAQPPDAPEVR
ncbi:MAG: 4-(cytidine 5'-diphospho)-2-C-methyl-D-erythritol kinase [Gemmatimonadetes bacterium]|nr:4-(cytidine 5'-diphospho)-2-C-methyl-D-erythritol kinase [Gemmatimonadota bacterium]